MSTPPHPEHGTTLWPPSFHHMSQNPQAQLHVATQLTRQSKYLQSRPFIHSSANIDKIIYRFNKEKSIIHVNGSGIGSGNGSGKKSECVSECVSECESDNEEDEEIEFGWGLSFDPLFISQLAIHGFLPMAGQCFADLICLLPKLHLKRCVMADLSELKVSRGARKRSRHYEVTIDQAFDEVITAIQVQHGENCWFYAPLTNAYREIHNHNSDISVYGIRIHSVEVWERNVIGEGGERVSGCESESGGVKSQKRLVAGEIGYTVGGCYTSLSGFRLPDADGAGTVQCCAVAKLLIMCGFKMWDLGMGMTYKYDLGAKDIPRNDFLSLLSSMRDIPCTLILENSIFAVDLLKGDFKK